MKRLIIIAASAVLMTGCSAYPAPTPRHTIDNSQEYLSAVTGSIQAKFYDIDTYRGMSCDLALEIAADGNVNSVSATGGDPALCEAAIEAIKQADMPIPSADVWKAFSHTAITIKPQ